MSLHCIGILMNCTFYSKKISFGFSKTFTTHILSGSCCILVLCWKVIGMMILKEGKVKISWISHTFFYKQPSCNGSNVKNDLKVKQLTKQPSTLKTLMQKILVGLWVKNFTFSFLSSLTLNFSTIVFGTTQLCTKVFRAETGNNRKIR